MKNMFFFQFNKNAYFQLNKKYVFPVEKNKYAFSVE